MDTTPPSTPREPLTTSPEVAAFLASVRDEYRAPLPNEVTSTHLRMILAASAAAPAPTTLRERWGRRARRVAAVGAVKIALTATAAAAATGTGLAATGALPDAVQSAVAGVAAQVGITLPAPPVDTVDTPGDRLGRDGEPAPGVGEGGVPALVEDGVEDLPGRSGGAPGHQRGDDGRPVTPADERRQGDRAEQEGTDRRPAEPGSQGERAEDRPEAGHDAGRSSDTPAAERPEPGTPASGRPGAGSPAAPPASGPETAPATGSTSPDDGPDGDSDADAPARPETGKPDTAPGQTPARGATG